MRTSAAILAGVLLTVVLTVPAYAEPPNFGGAYEERPDRPRVQTNVAVSDAGVTIYVSLRATSPGSPGAPGSTEIVNGPPTPSCTLLGVNIGSATTSWFVTGMQEHPGTIPHALWCDGRSAGIVWVPTVAAGPPQIVVEILPAHPTDPLSIAASVFRIVPLPPIAVGASPGTGLVALPSWYWVEGYGGETLSGSETLGNTTVEVQITPDRYEWAFGDGGALTTTSRGTPYPAESDIQHVYERAAPGTYAVRLGIVFSARSRVTTVEDNGLGGIVVVVGPWQDVGPITRTFTRPYVVRQVQSVLTAGD